MEWILELGSFLILLHLLVFFLLFPLVLTVGNLYNLFARRSFQENNIDLAVFILGPSFLMILWCISEMPDWDKPIYYPNLDLTDLHTPLASQYLPTVAVLALLAVVSIVVLRFRKRPFPPLPTAVCIAGVEMGIVLSIVFIVQIAPHLSDEGFISFYLILFPINYLLCVPRVLRRAIREQLARMEEAPPDNFAALLCRRLLSHSLGWVLAGFLLAVPLLAAVLCVLVLLGQAPDAAIRAFTETSDWALSQKTSPPPIHIYDEHYLCTVAVGGHPKLVRPLRYGIRHGRRIVVNRQLCIANAFEQLLMERTPRFHRAVRRFYDTHGYPLSKKITTPIRADITYLLMKPLEWSFLLCLYTFDVKPEDRIAMQYTQR